MSRPSRRWRPPPLILGSAAIHLAAVGAVAIRPEQWLDPLCAVIANHLVLTGATLTPRGTLLGPNWTRLPAACADRIAVTIDDGPDLAVTPRVLDLLDRHNAKATFFCIGDRARRHPALCREIVERGHGVENHSQTHPLHFSVMGPGSIHREIDTAQKTLSDITGRPPAFFRAPAGLRNPFVDPILTHSGLRLASWTRRGFDTRTRRVDLVRRRLLRGLSGRDILLLHDGHAARTADGAPLILAVLPALLDAAAGLGLDSVTLGATMEAAS